MGYARKSPTNESDEARSRLLTQMVHLLRKRSLADKVFVSAISNANEQMARRDIVKSSVTKGIKEVDGDTQGKINAINKGKMLTAMGFLVIDLLEYLKNATKVCLVAIDYAGLSTNVEDLNNFIRYKQKVS